MVQIEAKSLGATAADAVTVIANKTNSNKECIALPSTPALDEGRQTSNDDEAMKDRVASTGTSEEEEERERPPSPPVSPPTPSRCGAKGAMEDAVRLVKKERTRRTERKQNRSTLSNDNLAASSNQPAPTKTTKEAVHVAKTNPKQEKIDKVGQLIAKALEASIATTILKEKVMREANARRVKQEKAAAAEKNSRRAAAAIQAFTRGTMARIKYAAVIRAAVRLQALARTRAAKMKYRSVTMSIVKLQTRARRVAAQRRYQAARQVAISSQCYARRSQARRHYLASTNAVVLLQTTARMTSARKSYSAIRSEKAEKKRIEAELTAAVAEAEAKRIKAETLKAETKQHKEQRIAAEEKAKQERVAAERAEQERRETERVASERAERDDEADATTVAKNMAIADVDTVIGRAAEKATAEIKAIRRKRVVAAAKLAIASAEAKKLMAQAEQEAAEKKAAAEAEAKRIKEVEEEARRQEAEEEMAAEAEANEQMEPVRPTQEVPSLTPEPPSPTNAPLTPTTDNSKPQNERKVSANSTVWFKLSADKSKLSSNDAFSIEQWKQALSAPKTQASSTLDGMAKAGHRALRGASDYNMYCSALKQKFRSDSLFVQGLINELIRFLALKIFVHGLPHPSPDIEKAWSALMLFPQTYAEVCTAMGSPEAIPFHTASVTNLSSDYDDAKKERYVLTLSTYSVLFNEEPPSKIWWNIMNDNFNESSRSSTGLGMPLRWKTPGHTGDNVAIQDDFSSDDSSLTFTRDGTRTSDSSTDDYTISLPMFSIKLSANKDKIIDLGSKVAEWADWFDSPPAQKK